MKIIKISLDGRIIIVYTKSNKTKGDDNMEKVTYTFEFIVGQEYTNADDDIVVFQGKYNDEYVKVYYPLNDMYINIKVKEFITDWWTKEESE